MKIVAKKTSSMRTLLKEMALEEAAIMARSCT